jgi:uncharacterized protein (TIGR02271 family)
MTVDRDSNSFRDGDDGQAVKRPADSATLQVLAEELSVSKETVETGRVRVTTRTREREALIDEDLACVRVEIETVPLGQRIDAVPDVRQEGDTTIVPVVEEVLFVERQLVLKEEVRIRRVRTTDHHNETVTLRYQEAEVTRHQGQVDTGAVSVSGQADPKASDAIEEEPKEKSHGL